MKRTLPRGGMRTSTPQTASSRPHWSGGGTMPSRGPRRSRSEFDAHQATKRAAVTDEQKKDAPVARERPSFSLGITYHPGQGPQAHPPAPYQGYHPREASGEEGGAPSPLAGRRLRGRPGDRSAELLRSDPLSSEEVVDRVRVLAQELPDSQIAEHLNKEGVTSAKGTAVHPLGRELDQVRPSDPRARAQAARRAHRQRDRRKVRRKPPRGVLLDRAQGGLGTEASGWGAVLHQPGSGETKGTRSMGDRLTEDLEAEDP